MKLQTTRTRRQLEPVNKFIHPIFQNPPFGIYTRVARELGVSPSHVRKVALGLHPSKRVTTALLAEAARIMATLRKAGRAA